MEEVIRIKLQKQGGDMEDRFARKWGGHPKTWNFYLDPGDKVLMRQAVPGKNWQRAVGPLVYLRDRVGG